MFLPTVSVVIPTHNRCARLAHTLAALCHQTYPAAQTEVVVVADGCADETAVFVRSYQAPFTLSLVEQDGLGPAAARNSGAAHAAGEYLIFLDDDMEAVPGFIEAHVRAHQPYPEAVVIGPMPLAGQEDSYFARAIRGWWEEKFYQMRQPGYRFTYEDLCSGNFSLPATLFRRVGGFDTCLRCHEDYELGLRLLEAKVPFVFATGATSLHHDVTDLDRALQRRQAEGKADVYLGRRYPELRLRLPMNSAAFSLLSRTLRLLAFRRPSLGNAVAAYLRQGLDIAERLWLLSIWRYLLHHLRDYRYWCGVADEMKTPRAVRQFFSEVERLAHLDDPEMTLDLADGITVIEQRLDQARPVSLQLRLGQQVVGYVPTMPGAERLCGRHLRRILSNDLAEPTVLALSMEQVVNEPTTIPWAFPPENELYRLVRQTAFRSRKSYLTGSKKVVEVELSKGLHPIEMDGYEAVYLLVRYKGTPLGWLTWPASEGPVTSAETVRHLVSRELGRELMPHTLNRRSFNPPATLPPISVIVCTRDRTELLEQCLQALLALDYPAYEIVVVDNAPSSQATARLVAGLPVRYVCEARPGLDWARNRGIAEAAHDIVAFTDDDARVDAGWLRAVATAMAEPEVMAVTGPTLPAELETPAQNLFEFGYGGMSHDFRRRIYRHNELAPADLLWASAFGVGANMAFRRSLFHDIGAFDVALDVGTPSQGGGDVEMFHRVVVRGHTLVYEPKALVWHTHRRSDEALQQLVYNNGRSFGVYLMTCARNRTVHWGVVIYFAARYWLWRWIGQRLLRPNQFPRRLIWHELKGAMSSPWAYWKAQQHAYQIQMSHNHIT